VPALQTHSPSLLRSSEIGQSRWLRHELTSANATVPLRRLPSLLTLGFRHRIGTADTLRKKRSSQLGVGHICPVLGIPAPDAPGPPHLPFAVTIANATRARLTTSPTRRPAPATTSRSRRSWRRGCAGTRTGGARRSLDLTDPGNESTSAEKWTGEEPLRGLGILKGARFGRH